MEFKSVIEGLGVGAAPWVAGLFFLWMMAKWAVQTDLIGWPARSRRQRRADLFDSYEKMAALGPVDETVRTRVRQKMSLLLEGEAEMWLPASAENGTEPGLEAEVDVGGEEADVPWREVMEAVGVPAWMVALHRFAGLGAAAFEYSAIAILVWVAFWLPWSMFEAGLWPLGLAFMFIPMALVKSGLLGLAKRFPARLGFIGRGVVAWVERTRWVRSGWAVLSDWMFWQSGPLFVLGMGTAMMLSSGGVLWVFVLAFGVAALWSAKLHIEKVALRRAESGPRLPLDAG